MTESSPPDPAAAWTVKGTEALPRCHPLFWRWVGKCCPVSPSFAPRWYFRSCRNTNMSQQKSSNKLKLLLLGLLLLFQVQTACSLCGWLQILMSTAAWMLLSWMAFKGGESSRWRSLGAVESQAGGFPCLAQREEKGRIKPAKSRYFSNCSKGAVFIPGRNEKHRV